MKMTATYLDAELGGSIILGYRFHSSLKSAELEIGGMSVSWYERVPVLYANERPT